MRRTPHAVLRGCMRIVLLAPHNDAASGGAATYNRRMIAALADAGHEATLVTLAGTYPAVAPDPVDLPALAALPPGAHIIIDGMALAVHQALPQAACGLIHHPSPLHGQAANRAALDQAERTALTALPRLIATTRSVADRLAAEWGLPPHRIHVIAPGVDDLPRHAARAAGPCHILSLGPLVPRRAHLVLIAALARLFDLSWHLTLIGAADRDPAHAAALAAQIDRSGVAERITLAGEDTAAPWDSTDILALAHPVPGTTGAILHALRRGIPLALCSAEAALCPSGAGVVCKPGDADNLSRALRRMVFDTALRSTMAEAAWQSGQTLPDWPTQAALFAAAMPTGA